MIHQTISDFFPWPKHKPANPTEHGWLAKETKAKLDEELQRQPRIIIEIGSWRGMSALKMAQTCPNAAIYCIDPWLGLIPQKNGVVYKVTGGTLEDFWGNVWEYRDRVAWVRADAHKGLVLLHSLGIKPDFVYIDGGHDECEVFQDADDVFTLFPQARVLGDDYDWDSVKKGIEQVAAKHPERTIEGEGRAWWA